jgi:hypothetical protein
VEVTHWKSINTTAFNVTDPTRKNWLLANNFLFSRCASLDQTSLFTTSSSGWWQAGLLGKVRHHSETENHPEGRISRGQLCRDWNDSQIDLGLEIYLLWVPPVDLLVCP